MGFAADKYAQIQRAMFDDWVNRFYPKQKELLEKSQTGVLLGEQLSRVSGNAEDSLRAAQQGESNRMARYGLSSEGDENQSAKTALSVVAAKNGLRDHERERSLRTLSGAGLGARNYANHRGKEIVWDTVL